MLHHLGVAKGTLLTLAHDQQGIAFFFAYSSEVLPTFSIMHNVIMFQGPLHMPSALCKTPICCRNPVDAHEDSVLLSSRQKNVPCCSERSYLQIHYSICTYRFEFIMELKYLMHDHMGALHCLASGIPFSQLHTVKRST